MKHSQYHVTENELKAMSTWGSLKWSIIRTQDEKRSLFHLTKNYEQFKLDLQGFLVYSSRQSAEYENFAPLKNLWDVLSDANIFTGLRKNVLKDYMVENCGVFVKQDGSITRDKKVTPNWKAIAEKGWWKQVKASDDLSRYELKAIIGKFEALLKFTGKEQVTAETRSKARQFMLDELQGVEHEVVVEPATELRVATG